MALHSMTGFARADGATGGYLWAWELKSVNAKGLDLRFRVPQGWEAIEPALRTRGAAALSRGTVYANLTVTRENRAPTVRVNPDVLAAVIGAIKAVGQHVEAAPPTLDGILSLRGVMDVVEEQESPEERETAMQAVAAGFEVALASLLDMRAREGAALDEILRRRLDEIAILTDKAEQNPARQPEAIKARLAAQIATLLDSNKAFDADRLHQEALIIAAKADVREELDRLHAHIRQARELLASGGPAGRKLDFLSQEFNRETNTLCSKANDVELTTLGLELKTVVEQFREQVQNLE